MATRNRAVEFVVARRGWAAHPPLVVRIEADGTVRMHLSRHRRQVTTTVESLFWPAYERLLVIEARSVKE